MNPVRIETKVLPNGRVILNDLPFEEGRSVEVIVISANVPAKPTVSKQLAGSVIRYVDPFEPAASADEWELLDDNS